LSYEWQKPEAPWIEEADPKGSAKNASVRTDFSGSIWQRLLWGSKVTVGVNNAFDRNPPTVLAAPNDNYDTSLHTIRNRYWYVAVSKKF
jgi:outer membrane receptor protein involved in Fe transport